MRYTDDPAEQHPLAGVIAAGSSPSYEGTAMLQEMYEGEEVYIPDSKVTQDFLADVYEESLKIKCDVEARQWNGRHIKFVKKPQARVTYCCLCKRKLHKRVGEMIRIPGTTQYGHAHLRCADRLRNL